MLAAGLTPPSADLNESKIVYVYRLWMLAQEGSPLVKISDWKFKDRSGRWPVPVWITFNENGFKVNIALQAQHLATLDALVDESELYADEK